MVDKTRLKNAWEDILSLFLEKALSLRFDICTCELCQKRMMELLLKQFSPFYIEEGSSNFEEIKKRLVKENSKKLFIEIEKVIEEVSKNLPHSTWEDKEKEFDMLLKKIKDDRGIDFSRYHRRILKRRIALRLVAHRLSSYTEYLKILAQDPSEYSELFEVLTINVSEFFRDIEVWGSLKKILERIIERNNLENTPIVMWSAGCAEGEEPYSLSILMQEIDRIKTSLIIYATDIDEKALEEARLAGYNSDVLKNVDEEILKKYFEFSQGKYYLKEEAKRPVKFKYLDLTSSETIKNVDLIICRNVFIYFTKPLQEQILNKFYYSLKEEGYLVMGKTEILPKEAKVIFREVDAENRIYQKMG